MGQPRDPRRFRQFAEMAPDGGVAAIREVAEQDVEDYLNQAVPLQVDVTALYPYDFTGVRVTVPAVTAPPAPPADATPDALAAYQTALRAYRAARATADAAVWPRLATANKVTRG
jgi:hypothetical protein